ncbi:MAG: hypothetical protein ACI97K_001938 [Glaciecola sp.]|jgi:hypothetical protein
MIVWLWMYFTRIPAMKKAKIDIPNMTGGKGSDLDELLPPKVQWKAQNYNHLLTEPTLFYVICLVFAMLGMGDGLNLIIAWIYVALRVMHSLVQVTFNRIVIRFSLFMLSSLCIIALTIHAAIAVFH